MRCCGRWSRPNAPASAITVGRPGRASRWPSSISWSCGGAEVAAAARRGCVIVLTGPTGSGKSAAALALAARQPLEIVSVDSAQVYRGMDIGTAKPTPAERAAVPHHLIDIRDPAEGYSAGDFVRDALVAIEGIHARGRVPLLVGGTMLYLQALWRGLAVLPVASPERRARIEARARAQGWPALHAQLARIDPAAGARIHPHDPQRIQRALEVYEESGRPISEWQRATVGAADRFDWLRLALVPASRAALNEHLERRFHGMLAAGLYEEVATLHARGDLSTAQAAVRCVGYRQLWACFTDGAPLAAATAAAVRATRQLARRQMTWLRADAGVLQLDPAVASDMTKLDKAVANVCRGGVSD
ncbi:MAG: tRNA (adenosine(37)-N6)-dimethylallyltransferase MiaA [Gammaproteobacteria bacterium]|nr:tRNA (adenosine(37)-N6)-dimethylallyltransferase MiaA [Gammaproteobacteria bacterium]